MNVKRAMAFTLSICLLWCGTVYGADNPESDEGAVLMNAAGNDIILQPVYDQIGNDSWTLGDAYGLIPVKDKGKWGYIDMEGRVRFPIKYEEFGYFITLDDGSMVLPAKENGKWGLLTEDGLPYMESQFDEMVQRGIPFLTVRKGNAWGVLDANSRTVSDETFEHLSDVHDFYNLEAGGFGDIAYRAIACRDGLWGVIDEKGTSLGEGFIYQQIGRYDDDWKYGSCWYYAGGEIDSPVPALLDGKWVFIDTNGRPLMGGQSFDAIGNTAQNDCIAVQKDGVCFLIDNAGTQKASLSCDNVSVWNVAATHGNSLVYFIMEQNGLYQVYDALQDRPVIDEWFEDVLITTGPDFISLWVMKEGAYGFVSGGALVTHGYPYSAVGTEESELLFWDEIPVKDAASGKWGLIHADTFEVLIEPQYGMLKGMELYPAADGGHKWVPYGQYGIYKTEEGYIDRNADSIESLNAYPDLVFVSEEVLWGTGESRSVLVGSVGGLDDPAAGTVYVDGDTRELIDKVPYQTKGMMWSEKEEYITAFRTENDGKWGLRKLSFGNQKPELVIDGITVGGMTIPKESWRELNAFGNKEEIALNIQPELWAGEVPNVEIGLHGEGLAEGGEYYLEYVSENGIPAKVTLEPDIDGVTQVTALSGFQCEPGSEGEATVSLLLYFRALNDSDPYLKQQQKISFYKVSDYAGVSVGGRISECFETVFENGMPAAGEMEVKTVVENTSGEADTIQMMIAFYDIDTGKLMKTELVMEQIGAGEEKEIASPRFTWRMNETYYKVYLLNGDKAPLCDAARRDRL